MVHRSERLSLSYRLADLADFQTVNGIYGKCKSAKILLDATSSFSNHFQSRENRHKHTLLGAERDCLTDLS